MAIKMVAYALAYVKNASSSSTNCIFKMHGVGSQTGLGCQRSLDGQIGTVWTDSL